MWYNLIMDIPEQDWYDSFPTIPIGGGNPYYKCASCGRSVPEINYSLTGHYDDCSWRKQIEESN